jgi:hypothetical protein
MDPEFAQRMSDESVTESSRAIEDSFGEVRVDCRFYELVGGPGWINVHKWGWARHCGE